VSTGHRGFAGGHAVSPTEFTVRVYTSDPKEEGPDEQRDHDAWDVDSAAMLLEGHRRRGERAALIRRDNIRPERVYGMTFSWKFDEYTVLDCHEDWEKP